jgi:putative exosortase-associated protein (TIGR04073 family)
VLFLVILILCSVLPAYAQYEVEKTDFPGKRPLTKLGRGLANIFGGWAEIPKEFYARSKDSDTLGAILFTAPVVGIAKAVGRTAVGFFETATFFLPIPADYEPIVEPEYVF